MDARFDWFAGIVQLDATKDEYEQSFDLKSELIEETDHGTMRLAVPLAKARIHWALTHESLHFLQVVTTGYVYRWAVEYAVYATESWLEIAGDQFNEPSVQHEALHGKMKATDAARDRLRSHLRKLDRRGVSGLTVRSLIESHAYFVQLRIHLNLSSPVLFKALNDCPDLEYRVAYDATRFALGEEAAFELFSLMCNAALCTQDPVLAFERLLFGVRRLSSLRDDVAGGRFLPAWQALKKEIHDIWIGTAPQVRMANQQFAHPTCTPTVDRLIKHDDPTDSRLLIDWFADPRSRMDLLNTFVRTPVMLRSGDDGEFPIRTRIQPDDDSDTQDILGNALLLAAIVRQIFGDAADWESSADRTSPLAPLRWLTRDNHSALGLEVSQQALEVADTSRVEELLTPMPGHFVESEPGILESGEELARIVGTKREHPFVLSWHELFIGRFRLVFPKETYASGAQAQREFVTKLAERVPLAPAYLRFGLDRAGYSEWFGTRFEPNDPSFVLIVADAIVAIGTLGREQAANTWLQARAMVDPYTPDFAGLLLQHPLFENQDQS